MARIRLGELLVNKNLVTEEQVGAALKKQKESGHKLGMVFVELGFVTEEQLAKAIGGQVGVEFVSLELVTLNPDLVHMFSEEIILKYEILPVSLVDKTLKLAMVDPTDLFIVEEIEHQTGFKVEAVIVTPSDFLASVKSVFTASDKLRDYTRGMGFSEDSSNEQEDSSVVELKETEDLGNPVITLVNKILLQAIKEGVSDIHLEPKPFSIRVRYRLDGVLKDILDVPGQIAPEVISRFKIIAKLDIAEKRLPQDGRIRAKAGRDPIDLRVSSLPTVFGEKLVLRILDKKNVLIEITDVGFSPSVFDRFIKIIRQPNGIMLITGPTGSGKTTTLYGALNYINTPKINITTVEDPVEYEIEALNQVQIHSSIGLDFSRVIRAILRQDPDVLLIGEIRDHETAQIAIEAALTGHLVFSTLHTNDSPGAITRLIEMGVEPFLVASSILGILSQRLLRRICKSCVAERELTELEQSEFKNMIKPTEVHYGGKGCRMCGQGGYSGRLAIHELLIMNSIIYPLVLNRAGSSELKKCAMEQDLITLRMDGYLKSLNKLTTLEEVMRVTESDEI